MREIRSLSEYTHHLEKEWDVDGLLFRGQRRDHPLRPRIARLQLKADSPTAEAAMLAEFKLQAVPFLGVVPQSDWDWLALAQHHGMATRLLDWTSNPIAALWFTVERPPHEKDHGVVWVFEAKTSDYAEASGRASPFEGPRTQVFRPRHVTRRIIAQAGWFTVHKYLQAKKGFIPLEANAAYKKRLTKLRVPAVAFSPIRRELDRWGFNAATLYADLDGLCRQIEWQHNLLEDET